MLCYFENKLHQVTDFVAFNVRDTVVIRKTRICQLNQAPRTTEMKDREKRCKICAVGYASPLARSSAATSRRKSAVFIFHFKRSSSFGLLKCHVNKLPL